LKRVSGSLDEHHYRFPENIVLLSKSYCDNSDEPAAPEDGGSFVKYAMISPLRGAEFPL